MCLFVAALLRVCLRNGIVGLCALSAKMGVNILMRFLYILFRLASVFWGWWCWVTQYMRDGVGMWRVVCDCKCVEYRFHAS